MMYNIKSLKLFIILFGCLCLFSARAFCEFTPAQRHKRAVANKVKKTTAKKYQYIRNHDLNHDGKVDARDRLIWINNREPGVQPVLVSKENEDLLEVMDTDNNGSIEESEMLAFYAIYDTNNNGTLENSELNVIIGD